MNSLEVIRMYGVYIGNLYVKERKTNCILFVLLL